MQPYCKNVEQGIVKRESRFASKLPANEILSKIEQAATPLGFNVEKQNYKVCFPRSCACLAFYSRKNYLISKNSVQIYMRISNLFVCFFCFLIADPLNLMVASSLLSSVSYIFHIGDNMLVKCGGSKFENFYFVFMFPCLSI